MTEEAIPDVPCENCGITTGKYVCAICGRILCLHCMSGSTILHYVAQYGGSVKLQCKQCRLDGG